jgi:hypothetical protein
MIYRNQKKREDKTILMFVFLVVSVELENGGETDVE